MATPNIRFNEIRIRGSAFSSFSLFILFNTLGPMTAPIIVPEHKSTTSIKSILPKNPYVQIPPMELKINTKIVVPITVVALYPNISRTNCIGGVPLKPNKPASIPPRTPNNGTNIF